MQSLILQSHSQKTRDEITGIMSLTSELMAAKTFQFLMVRGKLPHPYRIKFDYTSPSSLVFNQPASS